MKNIIIFISFVLPLSILAQTKPMPNKDRSKSNFHNKDFSKISVMIMDVNEIKNKKNKSSFEFYFTTISDEFSNRMNKEILSLNFNSVVKVIDHLNKMGWHLVSVNNNKYFFNKGAKKYLSKN